MDLKTEDSSFFEHLIKKENVSREVIERWLEHYHQEKTLSSEETEYTEETQEPSIPTKLFQEPITSNSGESEVTKEGGGTQQSALKTKGMAGPEFETSFGEATKADTTLPLKTGNLGEFSSSDSFLETPKSEILERYFLLEKLGEGGMGVVERVQDTVLNREVALKKIKFSALGTKNLPQKIQLIIWRFKTEASITAALEHPNIVPLYDLQKLPNGEFYFTMRRIAGLTLNLLLKKSVKNEIDLPENKRLSIFLKVCDAIAYAHSKGIIHRDLKPDNIMVGEFGEVYVMDWGIAKSIDEAPLEFTEVPLFEEKTHTEPTAIFKTIGGIGTPGYMPPEQKIDAAKVTLEADIFALGKILRECFTCLSPMEEFRKVLEYYETNPKKTNQTKNKTKSWMEQIKNAIVATDAVPQGFALKKLSGAEKVLEEKIPKDIQAIIKKATADHVAERYSSVQFLIEDVERYQKNVQVSARDYGFFEVLSKWAKRNKQKIIVVSFFLFLCISFPLYFKWNERQNRQRQFYRAYQSAIEKKQKSAAIHIQGYHEQRKKIRYLLSALNHLNKALLIRPNDKNIGEEKWKLGQHLIQLTTENQNFHLAYYVAKEMEELVFIQPQEKERLLQQIEEKQSKTLRKHLARFSYWEQVFKNSQQQEGDLEDALFEISKMQEEEIFLRLQSHLKKGLALFCNETSLATKEQEFYLFMVRAFGRLENPKAGKPLLYALETLAEVLTKKRKQEISRLNFLVELAQALNASKTLKGSRKLQKIRWKMGNGSLFWMRTQVVYNKLFLREGREKVAPSTEYDYKELALLHAEKRDYQKALEYCNQALNINAMDSRMLNNRGNVKLNLKDYVGALKDFKLALLLNPFDPLLYNNRGLVKKELGDTKGALKDFEESIRLDPKNYKPYNNRALLLESLGQFATAEKDYSQSIRLATKNPKPYVNRGRVLGLQQKYKAALQDYNKAIELAPKMFEAYSNRASTKADLKDFRGAIDDYSIAIHLNPQSAIPYNNRGKNKVSIGNILEGIEDYNEALRIDPNYGVAYNNRGLAKKKLGDDKGALLDFRQALRFLPKNPGIHYNQGLAKYESKDFRGSIEDYSAAIQLDPANPVYYDGRGISKRALKDLKGAIEDFTLAIQVDPNFATAYNHRGVSEFEQGRPQKAIKDYNQALLLDPENASAYNNRGFCRNQLQDFQGAIEDYTQAIRLNPRDTNLYINRGLARFFLRDFQGAIEDYGNAIQINPEFVTGYINRGVAKVEAKDFKGAIQDYNYAIKLNKNLSEPYWRRAYAKSYLGKRKEAIQDYQKAIEIDPKNSTALFNLGGIYLQEGKSEEALSLFESGLKITHHPQIVEVTTDLLLQQIVQRYRKKNFSGAKESLLRFDKIAPANHQQRKMLPKMLQQIEAQLKKK